MDPGFAGQKSMDPSGSSSLFFFCYSTALSFNCLFLQLILRLQIPPNSLTAESMLFMLAIV